MHTAPGSLTQVPDAVGDAALPGRMLAPQAVIATKGGNPVAGLPWAGRPGGGHERGGKEGEADRQHEATHGSSPDAEAWREA